VRLRDEVEVVEVDDGLDTVASAVDREAERLGQPGWRSGLAISVEFSQGIPGGRALGWLVLNWAP